MELDNLSVLLLLSGAMVVLSFASGYLPMRRKWSTQTMKLFVAFGGGALIAAAFLLMVPESLELMSGEHGHDEEEEETEGDNGEEGEHEEDEDGAEPPLGLDLYMFFGMAFLHGFMFMLVVENFGILHDIHEEECAAHKFGMVAFIGMTMHTFIDGVALGAAARTDEFATLGVVVFIAIASHKMPASFTLGSILTTGGCSQKKLGQYIGIFSVMVMVGALVSFYTLEGLSDLWLGATLAFSAGTFLYVAAVDVLPEMHHEAESRYRSVAALVAGTLIMLFFAFFGGH